MHEIQMLGLLEADVLSSIEVPYLPIQSAMPAIEGIDQEEQASYAKAEADKFDMDIFSLRTSYNIPNSNKPAPVPNPRPIEKRTQASTTPSKITTIEESPRRIIKELPDETPASGKRLSTATATGLSTSPSQASIHSVRSTLSKLSTAPTTNQQTTTGLVAKLAPAMRLFFRSGPSEPQTTQASVSASSSPPPAVTHPTTTPVPVPPQVVTTTISEPPVRPVAIKANTPKTVASRTFEEETVIPHRASFRRSPMGTPPRDDAFGHKRRNTASTLGQSYASSSPRSWSNPLQPENCVSYVQESLARRWEHLLPESTHKHDIKWRALTTPPCLPLTMEYLPSIAELESCYDNYNYDFVVDPKEMRSFLVKPPQVRGSSEEIRRAWALVVMRGMAAVRIAQGFQFILRPSPSRFSPKVHGNEEKMGLRKSKFLTNDDYIPKATGPADVLRSPLDPVYLSMTNEIHRISYTGDSIQVRRYVRRLLPARAMKYECFIWPKLGG